MRAPWLFMALSVSLALPACGGRDGPGTGDRDGGTGPCAEGAISCRGREIFECHGGVPEPAGVCPPDLVCVDSYGCRMCSPGGRFCTGNAIHICNDAGDGSTEVEACGSGQACRSAVCINACDAAREDLSTVGCLYYAVDLDNEYENGLTMPASEQFSVVLANTSDLVTVAVIVRDSVAPVGSPPSEGTVGTYTIDPLSVLRIDLPQREVDGANPMAPAGVGTFISSNAYQIETNFPVVAYQFNPIIQSYSNDASLLIPVSGLDTHYRVLGWPTTNPFAILGFEPDHSFVAIVGTALDTNVTVTLGGPIVAGGGIPATPAGGTVTVTLGPYEVLNLESDGAPGDLTGTVVVADKPVAVFSGGERGIAPYETEGIPTPPGGLPDDWCCTEHLEEQVFPTTTWGTNFVVTRSPVRGATWREPDVYRLMADKDATTITTNLPAPNDRFTLGSNEWVEFYAQDGFIMQADKPVSIEQILVSQGYVADWRPGHGGDPSMILFPPYEQYREDYVFLVPETFETNYVVVAMPSGTTVLLDGLDVNGDEFRALCTYELVGTLDGTEYTAATCPLAGGPHRVESSLPAGIMVYGYHNVGSYGYAGGANLTRINFI